MIATFTELWIWALLSGSALAGLVWLVIRLFPAVPVQVRVWAWRLVLLKFLLSLLPLPSLILKSSVTGAAGPPSESWLPIALFILLGVACLRLAVVDHSTHKIANNGLPHSDARLLRLGRDLAGRLGLRKLPKLTTSSEVSGPLVTSTRQPVIVLPAEVSEADAEVVLAHELAHVHHRDGAWQWVAEIVCTVFAPSPLAWLARRELQLAQELAADERAIKLLDCEPAPYFQTLLRQASPNRRSPRLATVAASGQGAQLKVRIRTLLTDAPSWYRVASATTVVCILAAGLLPLKLTAAEPESRFRALAAPIGPAGGSGQMRILK